MGGRHRARQVGDRGRDQRARRDHRRSRTDARAHRLRPDRLDGAADDAERAWSALRRRPRVPVDDLLQPRDRQAAEARLPVDLLRRRRDLLAGHGAGGVPAPRRRRRARAGSASSSPAAKGTSAGRIPERYTRANRRRPGPHRRHRSRRSDVERVHIERVPFTYPIYKLNYLGELTRNLKDARRVLEPAARRPLRAVLVQQHGPLDRPGPDDGRQDPAGRAS